MPLSQAYIVAARRSANGRLGGLHRQRRIEDLAASIIAEALADAGLAPARVDLLAMGNTSEGGNPAHRVGLVAGLSDRMPAITIDREACSGLDAVLVGLKAIGSGEADVVVAGGADALTMAPWRIVKPRSLHQTPRFIASSATEEGSSSAAAVDAANALASRLGLTRGQLDEHVITTHIRAAMARDGRRLVKEIVALKSRAEETRDELVTEPDMDDLEALPPLVGDGLATSGNMSPLADGAAFVVAVSERVYDELGRPPALSLVAHASLGVAPQTAVEAPLAAIRELVEKSSLTSGLASLSRIELGETSAAQAIALLRGLGEVGGILNMDGGQLARGNPVGAAGAVLVVRLFSAFVRGETTATPQHGLKGLAVAGAISGQTTAAIFALRKG